MEISTYDAWMELERRNHRHIEAEDLQYYLDKLQELDHRRSQLLARFPYSVVTTGGFVEHDYASRWCWQNIGPEDGPCSNWYSEYPGCPRVLATERVERGTRTDTKGNIVTWEERKYANPGKHRHKGRWSYFGLGKTGYESGDGEYCFANEADRAKFIAALPIFTWSESWDAVGG